MGANSQEYTIPVAIDFKQAVSGLDEMEAGLTNITNQAKGASAAITETFVSGAKSSEAFTAKMDAGAKAAKTVSDAAKAAGVDIGKAFSGDNIKVDGLSQKITEFTAKLRTAAGKPVDFKFNIDSAAVKTLVDKLTTAKGEIASFNIVLDSAKQRLAGLAQGSEAFNQLNDQIVTAETFLKNLKETTEETEKPTVTLRQQIRQMREELAQMELAGKGGTKEFIELSKRAGNLADQFGDTSKRVQALASDTKGFDAGITAIRGLAGAFATAQGAIALFGNQNEELQQTIAKVQGAMALLQGVQEVANVLNKDSALSVYLQTFVSKAHTEALVAETVAVEGEAVATVTATAATEAWTVALLANPITALIAVLATAAFTVYEFAKSQKVAGLNAEQFNHFLEVQQGLLEEDLKIISRRVAIEEANANSQRLNQSALQEIRLNALKSQKRANQDEFDELSSSRVKLDVNDKNYEKSKAELDKRLEDLETKRKDLFFQIRAEDINLTKQQNDERIKLQGDLLKEKQNQSNFEIEIAKQARAYLNQIQDAKISELREGEKKELLTLDQGLKEKIQGFNDEQAAKLKALKDQRDNLVVERQLADENGKKVIDAQVTNLNRQIALTKDNGEKLKALEVELTTATEAAKLLVIIKFAEQRRDIEFQVANTLISIQDESLKQKLSLIDLAAQHEIDIIERTNQDRETKDLQQDSIEKKRLKDRNDATLSFKLKQVDIEETMNNTILANNKKFFDQSRDAQALHNYLLAKNELDAAQVRLAILSFFHKSATDAEVVNLKNRIAILKGEMDKLKKDTKPQSLAELLFPDSDNDQKLFGKAIEGLNEVGKAVAAYTSLQIANQQKLIDAQKKVVSADDDALSKLQDRLKAEQDLKNKGYANNVDGIKSEIEAKNRQRDEDIRKQDEYQKKMEAIQKKALIIQTALQTANLITAATKIYLEASALGPIGVAIGVASVAAMIAAFVATKAEAFGAVNSGATTMADGGLVTGKSHSQGGQKYYAPDASGGVVELEADEFVTSKKQTEKYYPLLKVINDDKLKAMDDKALVNMLAGLGVHLQTEDQHMEALAESKENNIHQINQINVMTAGPQTPDELKNIDRNLQMMMNKANDAVTITEEGDYIVTRKGNYTKRVKKTK